MWGYDSVCSPESQLFSAVFVDKFEGDGRKGKEKEHEDHSDYFPEWGKYFGCNLAAVVKSDIDAHKRLEDGIESSVN